MKKTAVLIAAFIFCAFTLASQEAAEPAKPASESGNGASGSEDDKVKIGGEIRTTGGVAWEWDKWARPQNPSDAYQYISVDSAVWLEAHPADTVSAYGKALFSFQGSSDSLLTFSKESSGGAESGKFSDILADSFRIQSLYTRIVPLPFLALTGGKRELEWEMGYFFSPADYINREALDYTDPEEERDGPFALSAEVPVGEQLFSLHVIFEDSLRPWEIAVAPQALLQFGPVETLIGGKFQWNGPIYSSLGVQADVFLFRPFAEAGIEYFSDKKYIAPTEEDVWPEGVTVQSAPDTLILELSAGTGIAADSIGIEAYIQYLYNTWGNFYRDNFSILAGRSTEILLEEGRISESDLYLAGLHYLALDFDWNIFETGLRLEGTWLINLQALSYRLDLTLGYSPLPFIDVALNIPIVLHDFAGEFASVRNGWKGDFSLSFGTSF